MKINCPNCLHEGEFPHPQNGCVLAALIYVVQDRGDLNQKQTTALLNKCDIDELWKDIDPIIDKLSDGTYNLKGKK